MSRNWTIQVHYACIAILNWWHRALSPKQGWHFCLSATHSRFELNWQTGGRQKRVRRVPSQSRKEADGVTPNVEWKGYSLWEWAMALEKETKILKGMNIGRGTVMWKRTWWKGMDKVKRKFRPNIMQKISCCWHLLGSGGASLRNMVKPLTQHI